MNQDPSPQSNPGSDPEDTRNSERLKLPRGEDQPFEDIPPGVERLPYELVRDCYFKTLARFQLRAPKDAVTPQEFLLTLKAVYEQGQAAPAQIARRAALKREFRDYVKSCIPVSEEAVLASIFFSEPRTVKHSVFGQIECILAELRNKGAQSLIAFDGKLVRCGPGEPVSMLIATSPQDEGSFQFEVLYSRGAFEAELRELSLMASEPLTAMRSPYLLRRLRIEIAQTLHSEAPPDEMRAREGSNVNPDSIDLLAIERYEQNVYGWHVFQTLTTQGRFAVRLMWSEHDYVVRSFAMRIP